MAPTKRGDAGNGRMAGDGWAYSRAEAVGLAAPEGGPGLDTAG